MGSEQIDRLIRDLRTFDQRKAVVKQLRTEIRKPVPAVRKAIKRRAVATLPKRGGLNKWVASTRITAKVQVSSRRLRVALRGGRNSADKRSNMRGIDRGYTRHPTFGRRGKGEWHGQKLTPGYFTDPATEVDQWRDACLVAVDKALDTVRRGR